MLLHEFKWKKEVIESTEPVLVDFWASWCPPCRVSNERSFQFRGYAMKIKVYSDYV